MRRITMRDEEVVDQRKIAVITRAGWQEAATMAIAAMGIFALLAKFAG